MLARLTRALRLEAERWGNTETDFPPQIERSFALTDHDAGEPHVEGFRLVIPGIRVRGGSVFTVTVTEERPR